jgi:hypothetical protein
MPQKDMRDRLLYKLARSSGHTVRIIKNLSTGLFTGIGKTVSSTVKKSKRESQKFGANKEISVTRTAVAEEELEEQAAIEQVSDSEQQAAAEQESEVEQVSEVEEEAETEEEAEAEQDQDEMPDELKGLGAVKTSVDEESSDEDK